MILGRWQRRGGQADALRRLAGGRTVQIPGRAIWVLLGLPHWGALGAPDPARVLNRHVRPLLRAMTQVLRRNVAYFGRDHLVSAGAAAAWVGHACGSGDSALVETLIGAIPAPAPPHPDPRFVVRGDATVPPFDAFVAALAEAAGASVVDAEPTLADPPAEESEAGFIASGAVPVPIGFAEALVRHDGAEVIAARLRGDVQGPLDRLGDALAGVRLEAGALHAALARAQVELPGFFLLGVRDASTFAELVLATRDTALAGLAEKYRTLASLRARRDAFVAGGGGKFADDELAERGAAFRAVAARHPGALRQLEAFSAETLAARAAEVEAARATGRALTTPWIRVVLDFHGTLAAAIACRPPRPRPHILDVVFDELAARHGAPRATLEAMVFGAARG